MITLLLTAGWVLAALFGGLFWSERDRRLHAEGARYHRHQAIALRPDPGSDADLQQRVQESEMVAATDAFLEMARREGRALEPAEAAAHVRELLARAGGVG